jgi:hypothetical protein
MKAKYAVMDKIRLVSSAERNWSTPEGRIEFRERLVEMLTIAEQKDLPVALMNLTKSFQVEGRLNFEEAKKRVTKMFRNAGKAIPRNKKFKWYLYRDGVTSWPQRGRMSWHLYVWI